MKKISILLAMICILTALACIVSCDKKENNKSSCEHDYSETTFASTCKEKGYTSKVCKKCGETTNYNYTTMTACTPAEEWVTVKEATCTEVGKRTKSCTSCGATVLEEVLPLAEHQPVKTVTRVPTCKEGGIEQTSCNACQKVLSTETTDKLTSHNYEIQTIAPTDTTPGTTLYKCTVCSHSEYGEYVEVTNGLTAQQIYDKASKATVRVEAYDKAGKLCSIGTGFFINSSGDLVTNYHVIRSAYSLKVKFYDRKLYDVKHIVGYDKANDIAIIKVNKTDTEYLEISDENVKTGDRVYALGSPLGVDNIFSAGIISNTDMLVNSIDCIAFTAPISPGNSGGPLLNAKGEVVGINSMYIEKAQNLNFAILIEKVNEIDTSKTLAVADHYAQNLAQNAYEILSLYISVNATSQEGKDIFVIYDELLENNDLVGLEYYYRYDAENDIITIEMIVVDGGQLHYSVFLHISSAQGSYQVTMYDYASKQTTVVATADATVADEGFEKSFEKMFEFEKFRYDPADAEKYQVRQEFFYAMYMGLLDHFKQFLTDTGTGLTASHFKFA